MTDQPSDLPELHSAFLASPRRHILMVTNHGIHDWKIQPGLPDTGGQNVFVNQFADVLTDFNFKITIINRGGYRHPSSGEWQRGIKYKDAHQRIVYLEDGKGEFVRKEDMHEQIPQLAQALQRFLKVEEIQIDLIISHYWDAAKICVSYNDLLPVPTAHVWVPHSLGTLKKRNINPSKWSQLRIDERIEAEKSIIPQVHGVAATSPVIRDTLMRDYDYSAPELFLPPGVNVKRFYPRLVADDDPIWKYLSRNSGLTSEEVKTCKIITEISRTDTTKRKDILIQAFAKAQRKFPNSLLVVTIDQKKVDLAKGYQELIARCGIEKVTCVLGSIWDILPKLYAITDIYCTPSIMEGFGMAAQEAAATAVPVIASNLVPYVVDYLIGDQPEEQIGITPTRKTVKVGIGGIVVDADDIDGFASALEYLLEDEALRKQMGDQAYRITVGNFTWENIVRRFIKDLGI